MPEVQYERQLQYLGMVRLGNVSETSPLPVQTDTGLITTASSASVTDEPAVIGSATRLYGELYNAGATVIFLGGESVDSTGYPLPIGGRFAIGVASIYAVCATGETGLLRLIEVTR